MINYKKFEKFTETAGLRGNNTHIKVSIEYSPGSKYKTRGYYIEVHPVEMIKDTGLYCNNYSGTSHLLLELKRYSAKAFDKAVELAQPLETELVQEVIQKSSGPVNCA